MKLISSIYKSNKKTDTYLYVDKAEDLARVPDVLLQTFGKPEHVMTLLLSSGKKLARADAEQVMAAIQNQGFYLQLPPSEAESVAKLHAKNRKTIF